MDAIESGQAKLQTSRSAGGTNVTPVAPVSCLVFTLDEEINLPHCLASLDWCDDVVVVDSFSSDRTERIARSAGARFAQHEFTGFGDQRNWALEHIPLAYPWAAILDADERFTPALVEELATRLPRLPDDVAALRIRRRFHLWGRWLRHSALYPTWVVRLIRVGRVRYVNRGHGETQIVQGRIDPLVHDLIDENHRPIEDWWGRHYGYAAREASYELTELSVPFREALSGDPLRRRAAWKSLASGLPGRPFWYFVYSYFLRRGFLDGRDGFHFCLMKAAYQAMIEVKKHELRRLRNHPSCSAVS